MNFVETSLLFVEKLYLSHFVKVPYSVEKLLNLYHLQTKQDLQEEYFQLQPYHRVHRDVNNGFYSFN